MTSMTQGKSDRNITTKLSVAPVLTKGRCKDVKLQKNKQFVNNIQCSLTGSICGRGITTSNRARPTTFMRRTDRSSISLVFEGHLRKLKRWRRPALKNESLSAYCATKKRKT